MVCRALVTLDDGLESRVEEYRSKHYPKMRRAEALEALIEIGLSRPLYNDTTAKRALWKAQCEINQAKEIVRLARERLEEQPSLLLTTQGDG